jgi:hypothetical protein
MRALTRRITLPLDYYLGAVAEGLLSSKRLANGYRDFDGAAIETVARLACFSKWAFPLRSFVSLRRAFPEIPSLWESVPRPELRCSTICRH